MEKINNLEINLLKLYQGRKDLLFHGWPHILFVRKKALEFAEAIKADSFLVESAALVHDLNYMVEFNSAPEVGKKLREENLRRVDYSDEEIERIESIIEEANMATRTASLSKEGMALSDADTLFKVLPITPIIFSSRFIEENKVDIEKMAKRIHEEQGSLFRSGIYFYTEFAKEKYLKWAKINLDLWENVREALQDDDIKELISNQNKNV